MAKHKAFKRKSKKKEEHKTEERKEKRESSKKNNFWMWISIILAVIVLFEAYRIYTPGKTVSTTASESDVAKIANSTLQYINTQLLQGKATAELLAYNKTDYPGLYYIKISINGQTYESYVTSDGKLLFPSGIPIEAVDNTNKENTQPKQNKFDAPDSDKPDVKLFVMAFCPFGLQAEKAMIPVYNLLKDKADIHLNYVIYSHYGGDESKYCINNGTYCSMHGLPEVKEDIRQLCIKELYGKDKLWEYLNYFDHKCNYDNKETCWEEAANNTGLDVSNINTCVNQKLSENGETTLKPEQELDQQYKVQGSPTLIINGKVYSGNRSPEDYKEAICSGFTNPPSECNQNLTTEAASTGFGGGTSTGSGGQC